MWGVSSEVSSSSLKLFYEDLIISTKKINLKYWENNRPLELNLIILWLQEFLAILYAG